MSTNIKTPSIEDLVQQLSDVRKALTEERARLVDRIAVIDQALGVTPVVTTAKSKAAPKAMKAGGIREAITAVLAGRPGLTIREIQMQDTLQHHPTKSVEATVRAMASEGKLAKDDGNPKKFSLPTVAGGKS